MKKVVLLTLMLSLSPYLFSQNIDSLRQHKYRLKAEIIGLDQAQKSILLATRDSSIEVVYHPSVSYSLSPVEKYEIDIKNIESLKFHNKYRLIAGPILGAISGFALGASIGLISGDDQGGMMGPSFTAEEKAILFGGLLTIPGAVIGGVVGSILRVKIRINGNLKTYNDNIAKIRKYEY